MKKALKAIEALRRAVPRQDNAGKKLDALLFAVNRLGQNAKKDSEKDRAQELLANRAANDQRVVLRAFEKQLQLTRQTVARLVQKHRPLEDEVRATRKAVEALAEREPPKMVVKERVIVKPSGPLATAHIDQRLASIGRAVESVPQPRRNLPVSDDPSPWNIHVVAAAVPRPISMDTCVTSHVVPGTRRRQAIEKPARGGAAHGRRRLRRRHGSEAPGNPREARRY